MKKIFCFSLALLILTISILVYCPLGVFASYPDDYFSLSKPYTDSMGLSSSDAQAAVNAHKDIADSNGILCFQYTPTDTYNWTMNTKKQKIHLSDNQLKNLLMSKHSLSHGFLEFIYGASNSNAYRGFISSVGVATKTDSDTLLGISDKITGNYNYLNAIDYNEDTQTITMSNDNASVDKLREEIKQYYYDSIGLRRSKSNDKTKNPGAVITFLHTFYEYEEDYTSDFMACNQYDYATCSYMDYSYSVYFAVAFDKSSYSYAYIDNSSNLYFTDKDLSILDDDSVVHVFLNHYKNSSTGTEYDLTFSKMSVINGLSAKFLYSSGSVVSSGYINQNNRFYSQKGIDFVYFSSFEKLYNFVHGSQTAYLSSRIDKAGEDISYSFYSANELAKQEGFNTRVCLTTLYNYFNKRFIKLKKSDMPYNKAKKVKQEKESKRIYRYGKRSIEEREDLKQRDIYGHWEMDTVQGTKTTKPCILVLSERKTRQELLFKLDNKQCASVWNTIQKNWDNLKHYIKSITCDNGVEFSTNCDISNNELIEFVRTNLYYCHPYRSGERGTNENQNKLIRRFYPKGVDLSEVTQEELNKIQDFINNMPRKLFNGLSSNQFLEQNEMEYLQT